MLPFRLRRRVIRTADWAPRLTIATETSRFASTRSTRAALRLLSYERWLMIGFPVRINNWRLRLCWQVRARHLCLHIVIRQDAFVASISILVADVPIIAIAITKSASACA